MFCYLQNFPESKDLTCDYYTNGHPYYLLQPVKREVVFKAPRIVLFHDVVSDKEIEIIKFLAQPRVSKFYLYLFFMFLTYIFSCLLNNLDKHAHLPGFHKTHLISVKFVFIHSMKLYYLL